MSWIELTLAHSASEAAVEKISFGVGKEFAKFVESYTVASLQPSSQARIWINLDRARTIHFADLEGSEVGVVVLEKLPYVTKEPAEIAQLRRYLETNQIA